MNTDTDRRRAWLATLAASLLLATAVGAADSAPRGGLRPPTPEEQAWWQQHAVTVTAPLRTTREELPGAWKNWQFLPAVRSQQLQSCGAFAPTYYYKTWQEAREHGWPRNTLSPDRLMSPGFTYPLVNGGKDEGASVHGTMQLMVTYGVASEAVMPENSMDFMTWPTPSQFRAALPYRAQAVGGIAVVTEVGLAALKEHLVSGDLAVVVMPVAYHDVLDSYPSGEASQDSEVIYGPGTYPFMLGDRAVGHALTVIGYDDAKAYTVDGLPRSGAVLCVNSWGQSWGVADADIGTRGFLWIGYDYFRTFGEVFVMIDRIGYVPHAYATFGLNHGRRAELAVSILLGDRQDPSSQLTNLFPLHSALLPIDGRVLVDLTELTPSLADAYWLQVSDGALDQPEFQPPLTGLVTHFSVDDDSDQLETSADVPMATVDMTGPPSYGKVYLYAGTLTDTGGNLVGLNLTGARLAWADSDADGDPDLAVSGVPLATGGPAETRVLRNAGRGQFVDTGTVLPTGATAVAWVDVNRDGYPDLVLASATTVTVFCNDGSGGLSGAGTALPGTGARTMAWADLDNDGAADVALAGDDGLRVLRNGGDAGFAELPLPIEPPTAAGGLAWIDVDQDGYLDLAVASAQVILHNRGGGTFEPGASLPGDTDSSLAVGDANGDTWPDLAIVGGYRARLLTNLGDGRLAETAASPLAPVTLGAAAWGDLNNDGRLDLAVAGMGEVTPGAFGVAGLRSRVYRQQADGSFLNTGVNLAPVYLASLGWADVDGDGDQDLGLGGTAWTGEAPSGVDRVYTNSYDARARNQLPAAPLDLEAVPTREPGVVALSWGPGTDAETATVQLAYNLRVGTTPGGHEVVSGAMASSWQAHRISPVLAPGQPGLRLTGLVPGRAYYWSAQTLDSSLAASPWSRERRFTVDGPLVAAPSLPYRVGGHVLVDGVAVEPGAEDGLLIEILRRDGTALPGPVQTATVNAAGCYVLDVPLHDGGGSWPGDALACRVSRYGRQLAVLTPMSGRFHLGEPGVFRRLDLVAVTNPALVSLAPAPGATAVPVATDLVLAFDQPVQAGVGHLSVQRWTNGVELQTVDLAERSVRIDGGVATVTLAAPLPAGTTCRVVVAADAFVGVSGAPVLGLSTTGAWVFATAGTATSGPQVVLQTSTPVLTRDRTASFQVSGTGVAAFRYQLDAGVWSAEQAVASRIELATLADGPHALRVIGRTAAGTWRDPLGATACAWTVDATPPVLLAVSPQGDAGAGTVVLTLAFDEPVQAGPAGGLSLRDAWTGVTAETMPAQAPAVTIAGPTAAVVPATTLAAGQGYAVLVDAGAFTDLAGNACAGLVDPAAWRFFTGAADPGAFRFVRAVAPDGSGDGQLWHPPAMAGGPDGNTWVIDGYNWRLLRFSAAGVFVGAYGGGPDSGNPLVFDEPAGVAVNATGEVFVSDARNRVQKLDASGQWLATWGTAGTEPGQLTNPGRLAVDDAAGRLYVVDRGNERIQAFTFAGAFIGQWGGVGLGDGQFTWVTDVAVDPVGNRVFVSDGSRVQAFADTGAFLAVTTTTPGRLAVDVAGQLYVLASADHRVHLYDAAGTQVASFAPRAPGDTGNSLPVDLAATSDRLHVLDLYASPHLRTFALPAAGGPLEVSLGYSPTTIPEETHGINIPVLLSVPCSQAVTVAYAVTGLNATPGADFVAATGTLTFAPGTVRQTLHVAIANDRAAEGPEQLQVRLHGAVGAGIRQGEVTLTIVDDDSPTLDVVGTATTEGDAGTGPATLTFRLSAPVSWPVTVHYATLAGTATAGTDFTAVTGDLVLAAGTTQQSVTVTVLGDRDVEDTEWFLVEAQAVTGATLGQDQGQVRIVDNDPPPALTVADMAADVAPDGSPVGRFVATLAAACARPVSVRYATADLTARAGIDYVTAAGTLRLAAGQTRAELTVVLLSNPARVGDTAFGLTLTEARGATLARDRALGRLPATSGVTGWLVCLSADRADVPEVVFGRRPDATDAADPQLDIASPAPAATDTAGYLYFIVDEGAFRRDTRGDGPDTTWTLQAVAGAAPLSFAWDPSLLPAGVPLLLTPLADGRPTAAATLLMNSADTPCVVVPAGSVATFQIGMPPLAAAALAVVPGWNLLAAASEPLQPAVAAGLPQADGILGPAWSWQTGDQGRYQALTWLRSGTGFWAFARQSTTLSLNGVRLGHPLSLAAGWNLVGVEAPTPAPAADPDGIGSVWTWDAAAGAYQAVLPGTNLEPGRGYWFGCRAACAWPGR